MEEGVFFGVDGFFMCCEIVGVVGFLISTCVMRPSVFCSMKLLLFGGPFLDVLFDETAAAAPYELFVLVFDDDDDGVGDIVVPVVLCGVLFCSCNELFFGLEFNDGSIAFSSPPPPRPQSNETCGIAKESFTTKFSVHTYTHTHTHARK